MAIPFFGKKKPDPGKKMSARVAPRIAEPPKAPPAVQPNKSAEEQPAEKAPELPSLDFTQLEYSVAPTIEFEEQAYRVDPAAEQAAMLFAGGNEAGALRVLETAVDAAAAAAEPVWLMLFDLYQVMGKREEFETRGVAYALAFEKSPPSWTDACGADAEAGSSPLLALTGALNAASAPQIEQLRRFAAKNKDVQIDVGRLKDIDAAGCELLLQAIADFKRAHMLVAVRNAEALASLLEGRITPGRQDDPALWLLLLELYQQLGDEGRFEELALNYAVTFEVSPPSWETGKAKTAAARPVQAKGAAATFAFPAEVVAGNQAAFAELEKYAAAHSAVDIDMTGMRRMDFVSGGVLLNKLGGLQRAGKTVRLLHPNELVLALLMVLGVDMLAKVERRKR